MTKFFVYVGVDYYPYAETVEAETVTQAIDAAMRCEDKNVREGRFGVVVFPLDQAATTGDPRYWAPDMLRYNLER